MSEVVEGVIVERRKCSFNGLQYGQSTKIINRANGEITGKGRIPPYSVVVPGTLDKNNSSAVHYIVRLVKQWIRNNKVKNIN